MLCMATQLVTRVPDDLLAAIDSLVGEGIFASRSEAVRAGLTAIADRERRRAIGAAVREGYRRVPQSTEESGWSDAATVAMIADEPW